MKTVKCNLKNATAEDKIQFKKSKCLLLISVGQEAHESECFNSTIDLVNESFGYVSISLYDSIQRFTMALDSVNTPEFFHGIAEKEGDLWLKRNAVAIRSLDNLEHIFRWNDWIDHEDFNLYRNKLINLIKMDAAYKEAYDLTVENYLKRYQKNNLVSDDFNYDRAKEYCFEYILEECVVLCLWQKLGYEYEIYPNKHNLAIEATREKIIHVQNNKLLQPLTLRFRNTKQPKAQNFVLLD